MPLRQLSKEEIQEIESRAHSQRVSLAQSKSNEKSGLEKTSNTLGDIFGGKIIGDAIGTADVKGQLRKNEGAARNIATADYSKLTSDAIARLQAKGVPTTAQGQLDEVADSIKGPTSTQIAGDVGRVGLNFLPIGKASEGIALAAKGLGRAAKPLANLATGAGAGYLGDVTTKLADGQEKPFAPDMGTAVGAAIPGIGIAGRIARNAGSEVLGLTSGKGAGTFDKFVDAVAAGGDQAKAAIRAQQGLVPQDEIASEARTGLRSMIKSRSEEYAKQAEAIGVKGHVDTTPIIQKFNDKLEKYGVTVGENGADFSRAPGLGRYQKDLEQLSKVLSEWGKYEGDNTVLGVDKLKQVIDDFRIGSADSAKFDSFVTDLRGEAKSIIENHLKGTDTKTLGAYQKLLGDYEKATASIRETERLLSLGGKSNNDAAFKKLSGVFRGNSQLKQKLLEELNEASGGTLIPKIAGSQFSEYLPSTLSSKVLGMGIGGGAISAGTVLGGIAGLATLSPKVVGYIGRAAGFTLRQQKALQNAIFGVERATVSPGDVLVNRARK